MGCDAIGLGDASVRGANTKKVAFELIKSWSFVSKSLV